jgi:hypothetical protein
VTPMDPVSLPDVCRRVRWAAMALHDGEIADLSADDVTSHVSACDGCRESIAGDRRVVALLDRSVLGRPPRDLWPDVRAAISDSGRVDRRAFAATAAVFVCWRAAQLAVDLPAPVINGLLPLAAGLLLLRPAIGLAFTFGGGAFDVSQERVS